MDKRKITTTLRQYEVPRAQRRRFGNVFEFATWVRDARTDVSNFDRILFGLLAFEFQNDRRLHLMKRIHATFNRERQNREARELSNAS